MSLSAATPQLVPLPPLPFAPTSTVDPISTKHPLHPALHAGNLCFSQNDYTAAFAAYARGLLQSPNDATLWFALGAAASGMGNTREAQAALLKSISLRPQFPEALLSLGNEIYHGGNFLGAAAVYLRAILQRPRYAKAHCNLGNALSGLRRYNDAIKSYQYALRLDPDMLAALHNLGNAFLKRREFAHAEIYFRAALELAPRNPQFHNSLGNALLKLDRPDQAAASYRRAVELDPTYSAAHTNLANAFLDLAASDPKLYDVMLHHYRRGVQLDPNSPGGQYNLALALLRSGNFREGWPLYEWRWKFRDLNLHARNFPQPQLTRAHLNRESLAGTTILLHAEQGLGDTLQFVRYLPLFAQYGAKVILEVQPRLHPLLATPENMHALGATQVLAKGEKLPAFDYHAPHIFDFHSPLMGLPALFQTTIETIPNSTPSTAPYIQAPAEKVAAAWQKFPRINASKRIGLVWEGNLQSKSNLRRSTTLEFLLPILATPNADFYSLQFGPAAHQIDQLHAIHPALNLHNASAADTDLASAAALISTLDLVITIDTSIAHLAAALDKPTWIMLPYRADWRWMDSPTETPWYPNARLFRQSTENNWPALAAQVRNALIGFTRNIF